MESLVGVVSAFFSFLAIFFFGSAFIIAIFVIVLEFLKRSSHEKQVKKVFEEGQLTYLLIKIPSSNDKKQDTMVGFLHSLHRILPNNTHFSLEMVSSSQFLSFYIVTNRSQKNIFEAQLYAQFPEAEVEEVIEYLPEFDKQTAFMEFKFKRHSMRPLLTFQNIEEDVLKNLSAILAKTEIGDEVYVQFVLKRVGSKLWERGYRAFYYKHFGAKTLGENPHPAYVKLSHDLYLGKLRIAYVAKDAYSARAKLDSLFGVFKSMKSSYNELKMSRRNFSESLVAAWKSRLFLKGDLWHIAEIATIYHFPFGENMASNVVHTTSKRAPAPDVLPREGTVDPRTVSFMGMTDYRNEHFKFGLKRFDRRRHLYVVGKTGSGKSRMLELLLISDIQQGQGCCILDPHGDLADELLKFVPQERIKDVVYVNPADREFPIGFNPLESVDDYEMRQHLSRFFIAIFKKLFTDNWNARMEHLIRYITLALLETPDSNVLGIMRMLSDTAYRQRVIKQVQDPVVKSFWTNEFSASNEQFMDVAAIPIMNKVGQFISNPVVRNMVGQLNNKLDFEKFMNEGKIVIINASKGKLGEENSALLGSMFITKIQEAALRRANIPEEQRRDFYFYVDEFQNFATDAFSSILSEARKYHLDLTIAHQYIAQLPEDVKATAFGNVGTIITFAIGGDDAAYLSKEFSPVFTPDDMINLNTREMYIKMSIDGRLAQPFSARTLDVPRPTFDYSAEIIENSRRLYAGNRAEVEREILQWSRSNTSVSSQNASSTQLETTEPTQNIASQNEPETSGGDDDGGFPEPII